LDAESWQGAEGRACISGRVGNLLPSPEVEEQSSPSLDIDFVVLKDAPRQINVLCISCTFRFLYAEKFIKLVTKMVTI